MILAFQINDVGDLVKNIGLPAALIVAGVIGGAWALRYLFNYFTTRLDKKDEQIVLAQADKMTATERYNNQLLALMDSRHQDLIRQEKGLDASTTALQQGAAAQAQTAQALQVLAAKIDPPKKKPRAEEE